MKLLTLLGLIIVVGICCWLGMIRMPGRSYSGSLPDLSQEEKRVRHELRRHVQRLAGEIGERNLLRYDALSAGAAYLEAELTAAGYNVRRQVFEVLPGLRSAHSVRTGQGARACYNLEVELPGRTRPQEIVLIGAHYDSAEGTPGANDNATGTAALLVLARAFAGRKLGRTIRLVLFVNEEPPYFQTPSMGSLLYAKRCRERSENVWAMLSLETIGFFSDQPGSQNYPFPIGLFYPSTADFIGFVGNTPSRALVHQVIRSFRATANIPSEGVAAPAFIPGIGWSDHWAFWQAGYHGVMVTDTALFRYTHYHTADDTPDRIDYDRMTLVVTGLEAVIENLATVE